MAENKAFEQDSTQPEPATDLQPLIAASAIEPGDLRPRLSVGARQLAAVKSSRSLSNRRLGAMLGVSAGRICEILNGRREPSDEQRERIRELFGVLDGDFDRPATAEPPDQATPTIQSIQQLLSTPGLSRHDRSRLIAIIAKLVNRA